MGIRLGAWEARERDVDYRDFGGGGLGLGTLLSC